MKYLQSFLRKVGTIHLATEVLMIITYKIEVLCLEYSDIRCVLHLTFHALKVCPLVQTNTLDTTKDVGIMHCCNIKGIWPILRLHVGHHAASSRFGMTPSMLVMMLMRRMMIVDDDDGDDAADDIDDTSGGVIPIWDDAQHAGDDADEDDDDC